MVKYTQCTVKLRSLKLRFSLVVHLSYATFWKLERNLTVHWVYSIFSLEKSEIQQMHPRYTENKLKWPFLIIGKYTRRLDSVENQIAGNSSQNNKNVIFDQKIALKDIFESKSVFKSSISALKQYK